jgi:hypothetical protein
MKEYKVGDTITIRKDITIDNINELMKPYFGAVMDNWEHYYNMLVDNNFLEKRFKIIERKNWIYRQGDVYKLDWKRPNYISPELFVESFSRQIILSWED